jgi:hypothetical protein
MVRTGKGCPPSWADDRRPEAAGQGASCGARWIPELARLTAGDDVLITRP